MLDHTFTIRINLIFSIFMLALSTTFVCAMDIFQAAEQGDLATMQSLIQNDPNLAKARDKNDFTLLHHACSEDHLPVVRYLIEQCKADCNVKDSEDVTPLHIACEEGHLPMVQYLIDQCKADCNAKMYDGCTALHIASDNGHLTIVQYLTGLDHVDCNAKDNDGWTPLHYACQKGDLPLVQYLTRLGHVDCNAKDNDGSTALHIASANGRLTAVQYLTGLDHVDCNAKANDGSTALHGASFHGHLAIVQHLTGLDHVDCNAKAKGWTPLSLACQYGHFDIVRFLLYNGANKKSEYNDGALTSDNNKIIQFLYNFPQTSPHSSLLLQVLMAVQYAPGKAPFSFTVMRNAITKGADVDAYGLYGNTPLHFATQADNWQAVLYLLLHGANPTLTNSHQQNPLQVAIKHSQWHTLTIFFIAATATKDPLGNNIDDAIVRKNAQQCHTIVNKFSAQELPTFGEPARKRRRING
jgi:ankyrin repeat protein